MFLLELVVEVGENLSSFLVGVRKSPHVSEEKHRWAKFQMMQISLGGKPRETRQGWPHRAPIPSPLPLRIANKGRNHLNEDITTLLPIGKGE